MRNVIHRGLPALALAALAGALTAVPAMAQVQFRQQISNDPARCRGNGPAIRVNISDIESAQGTIRVQLYRGIESDWLETGRWIYRMEAPARAGSMNFCMPVPQPGTYGVAVRHDVNGNGSTDIRTDGGAMSNNPSLNIFNLGKPSYTKTRFDVGSEVVTINIRMRYF
ncbi:DUF2141 domain-containing protein [Alteraurantiacibacter aquimixticola]|uniref:DUF2141 domain-containing protein n=1 Tax=Alteraurantiacibacter aquimixticola TaxID=2489173 RepID=A0A4T3EYB7_9SPHN|nr:DUF2141 domain-containing protein [Alteraurantiacibacter aquimixticola]TIX49061.1 DUF2141 domain-containing protein [Alteraurantiacibacter aquimixticola]